MDSSRLLRRGGRGGGTPGMDDRGHSTGHHIGSGHQVTPAVDGRMDHRTSLKMESEMKQ